VAPAVLVGAEGLRDEV